VETTSIEPSFGKGISAIEIRGYDRLHRLRFGKKRRTFTNMKDSDIISTIAGDWDLRLTLKIRERFIPMFTRIT